MMDPTGSSEEGNWNKRAEWTIVTATGIYREIHEEAKRLRKSRAEQTIVPTVSLMKKESIGKGTQNLKSGETMCC